MNNRLARTLPLIWLLGWAVCATGVEPSAADAERQFAEELLREAAEAAVLLPEDGDDGIRWLVAMNQVQAGDLSGALETLATFQVPDRKNWALYSIAVARAEVGDAAGAIETAMKVEGEKRDEALENVVHSLAQRGGDLDAALKAAEMIEGRRMRGYALAEIGEAYAKAGASAAASPLLREAFTLLSGEEGWRASIASTLAQLGNLDEALRLAAAIKWKFARGSALSRIAAVLAQAGDYEEADKLFSEAIGLVFAEDSVKPIFTGPEDILRRVAESGRAEIALEAVDRLEPGLKKADMLMNIAAGQALAGDMNAALATLQLAEDEIGRARATLEGVSPDFERDEYYARIVCLDHYDCPTVLRIVAREQLKAGDISGALTNVERIPHGKDRVAAFQEVAAAQLEQGERADALGTLQRAAETAWTLEDGYERFTNLLGVAVDMGRAGDKEGAGAIFIRIFELAEKIPESPNDVRQKEDYWARIAEAQAKAGNFDAALQTIRSANARVLVYSRSLREIATQQAKAGDATAAAAWARLEGDPMARAAALLGVAEGILERLEEEAKSDPSP